MCRRSFLTPANPADALFAVVHRTVLAGGFAVRLVRWKRRGAKDCYQNRKQTLRTFNHELSLLSAND
jgi:hypothetical protein